MFVPKSLIWRIKVLASIRSDLEDKEQQAEFLHFIKKHFAHGLKVNYIIPYFVINLVGEDLTTLLSLCRITQMPFRVVQNFYG